MFAKDNKESSTFSINMIPDLNCDMGEGIGNDEALMPFIDSANIACGFHAGNSDTMRRTIELALQHNVKIGAHPSFRDRENFGRVEMHLSKDKFNGIAMIYGINGFPG